MVFNSLLRVFRPMVFLMAEGPKDPDFVDKYRKLHSKYQKFITTFDIDHKDAYLKAADKHLRDTEGLIDYDKLKEEDARDKFSDELAKVYREKAAKHLKSSVKPEDEFGNELLMNAVYGTTKAEIKHNVAQYGKKYTVQTHQQHADSLMRQINQKLMHIPSAHIGEKNIEDIIKYTKADVKAADHGYELVKPALRLEDANEILSDYVANGNVSKDTIEQIKAFRKKKK